MGVSVRDVAMAAGVSVGTVSNVLNRPDRVSPATVTRVREVIDRLGFVRNDAARQLRAGSSRTIGLIVLDLRNPFFTDVARGAEDAASELALSVLVANSDENTTREETYLELFEQQRVAGVLVTPVGENMPRIAKLRDRGIPVVLVDRQSSDPTFPSVAVDDIVGGRLAAEHLLSLGRRHLAFVGGPLGIQQVADRLEGARQAIAVVASARIEMVGTDALTVVEGRRAGARLAARLPGDRPDALFAANDLVALGLLQSLVMTRDLRVPEDVALIGYDDIDFASAAVIPLSSVRQPAHLIGATAVDLLLNTSRGELPPQSHVVFQPELVLRGTA